MQQLKTKKGNAGVNDTAGRLYETLLWLSIIFDNKKSMMKNGKGWKAILYVRFLHARIRNRLKKDKNNVAINQLHLIATCLGFQINVLFGLQSIFGLCVNKKEREGYTMLWKYVGHLLGIEWHKYQCNALNSYVDSVRWISSVFIHLIKPDQSSVKLTNHVLAAMGLSFQTSPALVSVTYEDLRCVIASHIFFFFGF